MTTMIATIDEVIDFLQKHKEKDYKHAIIAPDPVGGWSAPSKKRKYYQANFAVARDVFAKDNLMNLMNAAGFAVFLYKDTSLFTEDTKAYFEEAEPVSSSSSSQEVRA